MDWHDRGLGFDLAKGNSGSRATNDGDVGGVSQGISDALADPIVQALLAADRVTPAAVAALSCLMAGQLATRERSKW
jgi:hypothetical protein